MPTALVKIPKLIEEPVEIEMEQPKRVYENLEKRFRELQEMYKTAKTREEETEIAMEDDSLCHVIEGLRLGTYEEILHHVQRIEGKRVVDIGCAYGHQSEVFVDSGVSYMGVTDHTGTFFNRDQFEYVVGRYPCELPLQKGDVAVSVLCLTWNCYLLEGEKTLHEQCQALAKDFKDCLLYMPEEAVQTVTQYFSSHEKIGRNLYHFSNIV